MSGRNAGDEVAGRYVLEALIGSGGMAEVWKARHLALNSFAAVKFLQGTHPQSEIARKRFTNEAQLTAQLKSQHAVQVFDFGVSADGHPYLVMELLEGETLGKRLEREKSLSPVDTARILGQSSLALARAHQLGIVHRDFKPDNVIISVDDVGRDYVKVVDFGIAKLIGDLDAVESELSTDGSSAPTATLTKTGSVLGTPFYMAPEQIRDSAGVGMRADIWAFGVVAFECLTGTLPFRGATLLELFKRIEDGSFPAADGLDPSIPRAFNAWFATACATDPRKRFAGSHAAWKSLVVALECGNIDLAPSITRAPSGEPTRPRVVLAASVTETADVNASTLQAEPAPSAPPPRDRRDNELGSFRRIPVSAAPDAALARTVTALPAAKNEKDDIPTSAPERQPRPRRAMGLIAIAVATIVLLGIVGTRVLRTSEGAATGRTVDDSGATTRALSAAPLLPAPVASQGVDLHASEAPPAPSASGTHKPHVRAHEAHTAAPSVSTPPASVVPSTPAPPTAQVPTPVASSPSPVDPASYR